MRAPGPLAPHPALGLLTLTVLVACGPRTWEPAVVSREAIPTGQENRLLRGHLRAGGMVVLSSWVPPRPGDEVLAGVGTRLGAANDTVRSGELRVPLDSVVLWATEDPRSVARLPMSGLTAWTALSGLVTITCVSDPKACFGSCPTFYVDGPGGERLVAEGFSSSFARVLEAVDVDALPDADGTEATTSLTLLMRNEAPETHAVRQARLLAVPKPPGARIVANGEGRFYVLRDAVPPRSCQAPGRVLARDCLDDVVVGDGREYYSATDSTDLAMRETVTVEFDLPRSPGGEASSQGLGLVVRARQSLLSTYVFYQTISYLGDRAEAWLAELERGDPSLRERALGLARELGDVEVLLERDGRWEPTGSFAEAGPIASDVHVIPLGDVPPGTVRIALRMARGNWRIDRLALARIDGEVYPSVLEPETVESRHGPLSGEEAHRRLTDPDRYLVTHRGDAYRLRWTLPAPASGLQLFLQTRGFYYEWMRPEWRADENAGMVALAFADPGAALRRMAPDFKAREAHMEDVFWSSRFRREEP